MVKQQYWAAGVVKRQHWAVGVVKQAALRHGVVDNPRRVYLVASLEIIFKIIFRIIPDQF